jgi:hypothetical protein
VCAALPLSEASHKIRPIQAIGGSQRAGRIFASLYM